MYWQGAILAIQRPRLRPREAASRPGAGRGGGPATTDARGRDRIQRVDGVFFVDLPRREQKDGIRGIDVQHDGLDPRQPRPADAQWTGAEITSS